MPSPLPTADTARLAPGRAARILSTIYLLAVVGFALHAVWHTAAAHYAVPNKDDWRILDDMFSKPVAEWVLTDQNGHLVPATLGLFYLDYEVFRGQMHLPVAASVISMMFGLGVLVVAFSAVRQRRDPLQVAPLAFAGFLFVWGLARHDLVWGLQGSVVFAATFTLVSLAAFGAWLEPKTNRGSSAVAKPRLLAVALVSAAAATFSQGIGASSWAGLVVVAVAGRAPLRVLALTIACALGTLAIYASSLDAPPQQASLLRYTNLALSTNAYVPDRTLAFVGSPLAKVLTSSGLEARGPRYEFARNCGAVGVVSFVLFAVSIVSRRTRFTRRQALAIGLPTVALAGGAIVALNRVGYPDAAIHIRFATWSTLFWVGLAAALPMPGAGRWRAFAGLFVTTSLILLSGLTLPALADARAAQANRRDQLGVLRTLHLLGIRWDAGSGGGTLVASPDRSYRLVKRFRKDERSFFLDAAAELVGARLSDHARFDRGSRCAGALTAAERIRVRDGAALVVSGWGVERQSGARIDRIAIINKRGVVVGMGVGVERTARILGASLPDEDFPWTGFVRGNFAKGPFRAFGLLDDGRVACKLGVLERSE